MSYDPTRYLSWIPRDRKLLIERLVRDGSYLKGIIESPERGVSPETAMKDWESNGIAFPRLTTNRLQLALYYEGKKQRDFHISEWLRGVKDGLFEPEEFLDCMGMDIAEFKSVFGRYPDLRRWRFLLFSGQIAKMAHKSPTTQRKGKAALP